MEKLKKVIIAVIIVLAIAGIGMGIALNWSTIEKAINPDSKETTAMDLAGKSISLEIAGEEISIPPVLNEKVNTYLKRELIESGGLPIRTEKTGNALPFGIPL